MKRVAVIDVVGLAGSLTGPSTPNLNAFAQAGSRASIVPALPAVTCTAQANYLTGRQPTAHGIVANGWYHRELAEVHFWKQSDHLVQSPKLWDELRSLVPGFTCAKLFWWYNMYSAVDFSITPRPIYPADGRKVFDIYTWPFGIRTEIKRDLGDFPFPAFWGPAAGVDSSLGRADAVSRWIAASAKWIEQKHHPTLSLVYLPHLDYNFQRFGPHYPGAARDLAQIDQIVGDLVSFYRTQSVDVVVLSEYAITPVETPVHLNRLFRLQGWLAIKEELGLELLDPGASRVFAVADHQVAHVYLNDASLLPQVRALLERSAGVAQVLSGQDRAAAGLDHSRSGDLVVVASERAWFTYYYWLDDRLAPDFARTVDIHRKPGYDPVELFSDPSLTLPQLHIAWRLLQKRLGLRMLMDIIPLDPTLVRGSHGRTPTNPEHYPILLLSCPGQLRASTVDSTAVFSTIRNLVLG